jgi:hypothetical protein
MPNLVSPNNNLTPERSLMATPHADFQAKRCSDDAGNSKTVQSLGMWFTCRTAENP